AALGEAPGRDGRQAKVIEAVKEGAEVQGVFFDMWRQEHPDVALQDVPGDLVTTSGSGLDPDITLENARYQLDRVAAAWAQDTKRDASQVTQEIEALLQAKSRAPLGGLAGVPMVDVLEVNLELRKHYGEPGGSAT